MTGDSVSGCQALYDEVMKTASVIKLGTPFVENSNSDINNGYPIFEWQNDYEFKGKGTDESPYLITLKKELEIFRDLTNSGNADLNSDGKVDVFDIIIFKRMLLKK